MSARPATSEAAEGAASASLRGKMAVVTGASSGIGRAIAVELARRGAALCLIGRRPEALRETARDAGGEGALIYRVDLTQGAEIQDFAASLSRDGGRADILVHSAGVIAIGDLASAPLDEFDWQWSVNLRAPYLLTQILLPSLKARRGQVVFINSTAGVRAVPGSGQYSATKRALAALADSLREEVKSHVRVMNVFTGTTATPMQASLHALKRRAFAPENLIQPEDLAALIGHALSLPRSVEVTAIHLRPGTPPDGSTPAA